jgi:hypothetical protein
MTTPERREKSRQNRAANRHFRALRANHMRNRPSRRRRKHRGPIPAEPLTERDRQALWNGEVPHGYGQDNSVRSLEATDQFLNAVPCMRFCL